MKPMSASNFYSGGPAEEDMEPSSGSNLPYYKPKYAIPLKKILDEMMLDSEHDRGFAVEDFNHIRQSTLYLIISQAFKYVVDTMDLPDKRYANLKSRLVVSKDKEGHTVTLKWKFGRGANAARRIPKETINFEMKSRVLPNEGKVDADEWKFKFQNFISEGKNGEVLAMNGLSLKEEDLVLITELSEISDVVVLELERSNIKLFKGTLPDGVEI